MLCEGSELMKKFAFKLLPSMFILAAALFVAGCSGRAEAGFETFSNISNVEGGFIERVSGVDTKEELIEVFRAFANETGVAQLDQDIQLHLMTQTHFSREDYLFDFDYLIQKLDEAFNLSHYAFVEIAHARYLVENLPHVNDLIFYELILDGVFEHLVYTYNLAEYYDAAPFNMFYWDFGNFEQSDEYRREMELSRLESAISYDFRLPRTSVIVGFPFVHGLPCCD